MENNNSKILKEILNDIDFPPKIIYISPHSNAEIFIWNNGSLYMDIEIYVDGEILWGITNFEDLNQIGVLSIDKESILKLKKMYNNKL